MNYSYYSKLYKRQVEVVKQCINIEKNAALSYGFNKSCFLKAPPAFGKTFCCLALAHHSTGTTLIVVPPHLVLHWKMSFIDFYDDIPEEKPYILTVHHFGDVLAIDRLNAETIQKIPVMLVNSMYINSFIDVLLTKITVTKSKSFFRRIILDEPQTMSNILLAPFRCNTQGLSRLTNLLGCYNMFPTQHTLISLMVKQLCNVIWFVSSTLDLSNNTGVVFNPNITFSQHAIKYQSVVSDSTENVLPCNEETWMVMQHDTLLTICNVDSKCRNAFLADDYLTIVYSLLKDIDPIRIITRELIHSDFGAPRRSLSMDLSVITPKNLVLILKNGYQQSIEAIEHRIDLTKSRRAYEIFTSKLYLFRTQLALINDIQETNQDMNDLQTKTIRCVDFLNSNLNTRVIVFCEYPNTLHNLSKELMSMRIHSRMVNGYNSQAVSAFQSGEVRVLLLYTMLYTCGLGLPCATHVIFMNQVNHETKKQVVGLAHRANRATPLTVVNMAYVEECTACVM